MGTPPGPTGSWAVLDSGSEVQRNTTTEIRAQRAATLNAAYAANPDRFRHRRPTPPQRPTAAWINQPTQEALMQTS